jgi:hypothetical protein
MKKRNAKSDTVQNAAKKAKVADDVGLKRAQSSDLLGMICSNTIPRILPFLGDEDFRIRSAAFSEDVRAGFADVTPYATRTILASGLTELYYLMAVFGVDPDLLPGNADGDTLSECTCFVFRRPLFRARFPASIYLTPYHLHACF